MWPDEEWKALGYVPLQAYGTCDFTKAEYNTTNIFGGLGKPGWATHNSRRECITAYGDICTCDKLVAL